MFANDWRIRKPGRRANGYRVFSGPPKPEETTCSKKAP